MPSVVYNIDDPQNADRVIAAMKVFMAKNSVNGCLKFPDNGINYSLTPVPQQLKISEEPEIVVRFKDVQHFKDVHKAAAEFEERVEREELVALNNEKTTYNAWPVAVTQTHEELKTWLILVESRPHIESWVPAVGQNCQMRLVDPNTHENTSDVWSVRRVANNFAAVGDSKLSWSKLLVFELQLSPNDELSMQSSLTALVPNDSRFQQNLDQLVLSETNAITIGMTFDSSDATFTAEMEALTKLVKAVGVPLANERELVEAAQGLIKVEEWLRIPLQSRRARPSTMHASLPGADPDALQEKQVAAFHYLTNFRDARFSINMFDYAPYMADPLTEPGIPRSIRAKYERFNEHQQLAFHELLANMPCGMAFLPGGPGGGKTDWAMTVIGLMQSTTSSKVLYMLDINDPLDDAAAKYIRMMKEAGLCKKAIRMRGFGTELKKSTRLGAVKKRVQHAAREHGRSTQTEVEEKPEVDFSKNFLAMYTKHASGTSVELPKRRHADCLPTLDDAAWDLYENTNDDMSELKELLEADTAPSESRRMRHLIFDLYAQVLREADFIAATPCVAASAFKKMFKPTLIVFDEAAHARELSTLIAIANFCPTVGWIFIGDHRQTQPTVKSHKANPHGRQLATSTMERAHLAGVLEHQLLINHRAYGHLERLPSKLIYDGKMVSGLEFKERFPPRVQFIQSYFEGLSGAKVHVPRLVVHLARAGMPTKVGTSWYHEQHMAWTMARVEELLRSKKFCNAENPANRGTILILAPYKAAVKKYQEAIAALAKKFPHLLVAHRAEARTWDSSQGHEADIVCIDYVRDHCTEFMDGMYRFNVGLTRARQGEWHLMHPSMPGSRSFRQSTYLRKLYNACKDNRYGMADGRIVTLNISPAEQPKTTIPQPAVARRRLATVDANIGQSAAKKTN